MPQTKAANLLQLVLRSGEQAPLGLVQTSSSRLIGYVRFTVPAFLAEKLGLQDMKMNLKKYVLVSLLPFFAANAATADRIASTTAASNPPVVEAPITPVRQVEERLKAGDMMPLTILTSIDQQQISLTSADQRKLVIFFATSCHDSQRAFQKILASPLVAQPGLQIVGIGRGESELSLRQFAADYQVTFPLVIDADQKMYHQFTNTGVPRIVLVDADNRIVKSFLGEIPDVLTEIHW